jgi:PIN domain nuclease of toxin-antitoxin system
MSDKVSSVLDASALLAYLQDESGAEVVEEALARGSAMSAANWAEVLSKLAEAGQKPETVAKRLTDAGLLGTALTIVPLDSALAIEIGKLRPRTKPMGLGLGDRACLSLGRTLGLPVITTDRAWVSLKIRGLKVQLAR